jgi:type I restriction enzyme S subunit
MKPDNKQELKPKLRFVEFRDVPGWTMERLGAVASLITEKVGDKKCIPMSITSGVGLVSQQEKFGRIIAGDSYKNYLQLQKNDFAYNKSATKEFPQGFIVMYSGDEQAAVPNSIFTCFRAHEDGIVPDFLKYLFLGNLHGKWLKKYIEVSARAHGSLSIDDEVLLSLPIPLPSGESSRTEQQKIADCLTSLDDLITVERQKLDALKDHKKAMMQRLFPRQVETVPCFRFQEFQDEPEWEERKIFTFAKVTTGNKDTQNKIDDGRYPFFVRSQTIEQINSYAYDGEAVLTSGDGVGVGKNYHYINGKFDFHQRVYCIYDFKNYVSGLFFYLYFSEHFGDRVMKMSAKNSVDSVRMSMITDMPVFLPSFPEQKKIADCLTTLDELITAQRNKLEALKTHKKGLMQQLFPLAEVEA